MDGEATYGFTQGLHSGALQQQLDLFGAYAPTSSPLPGPAASTSTTTFLQLPYGQQLLIQQQHQQQQLLELQVTMYHPQQYGQSPYGGMGANAGMMQQTGGMAHVPADNGVVQGYQTPYSTSPYGLGIPSSTGPSMSQSYMTPTSNAHAFGMMNPAAMTPQQQLQFQQHQHQQHQQRMQPPPGSTSGPSVQRVSPYGGVQQNTPPQAAGQSQFMTPGNSASNQAQQMQHQNATQTPQAQEQRTPQTPNFPTNAASGTGPAPQTPLSPASESREKERVNTLLDINRELLIEVMRLQQIQADAKKDATSPTTADGPGGDSKPIEKLSTAQTGKEFVECMRRLQANLAYLAAIADRSHKPSSSILPHPAIISAPPLAPLPKGTLISSKTSSPHKNESTSPPEVNGAASAHGSDVMDASEDREERILSLKQLYAQLQALFPGADPKKEPPIQKHGPKASTPRPSAGPGQNANQAAVKPVYSGGQTGHLWQGGSGVTGIPLPNTQGQAGR